jgi:hypothetical protein
MKNGIDFLLLIIVFSVTIAETRNGTRQLNTEPHMQEQQRALQVALSQLNHIAVR